VNTLLLNPLPFPDANHLVIAWTRSAKTSDTQLGVTPEEFEEWQKHPPSYMTVAGQYRTFLNLSGTDEPERIQGGCVSTNFFSMLGIKPARGRDFLPEEDELKGGRVVILSESLWRRRFNADPSLIGGTIRLNDQPYTVVGILPPQFRFPQIREEDPPPELWTPFHAVAVPFRGSPFLPVFARLKAGMALGNAQRDLIRM